MWHLQELSHVCRNTAPRYCLPWLEVCLVLIGLQVNQAWEEQNHVSSLVHDWAVAEVTANLAWKLVLNRLVSRVIPLEVVVTVREVDIVLVEDGSPLEWSSCEKLASVLRKIRIMRRMLHG